MATVPAVQHPSAQLPDWLWSAPGLPAALRAVVLPVDLSGIVRTRWPADRQLQLAVRCAQVRGHRAGSPGSIPPNLPPHRRRPTLAISLAAANKFGPPAKPVIHKINLSGIGL